MEIKYLIYKCGKCTHLIRQLTKTSGAYQPEKAWQLFSFAEFYGEFRVKPGWSIGYCNYNDDDGTISFPRARDLTEWELEQVTKGNLL